MSQLTPADGFRLVVGWDDPKRGLTVSKRYNLSKEQQAKNDTANPIGLENVDWQATVASLKLRLRVPHEHDVCSKVSSNNCASFCN